MKTKIDTEINSGGLRAHSLCFISFILHMATLRKKTLNQMEIDEILNDSESGLEAELADLNLSSTE